MKPSSETKSEEAKFRQEFPLKAEKETQRRFNRIQQKKSLDEKIDRLIVECHDCETEKETTALLRAFKKAFEAEQVEFAFCSNSAWQVFGGKTFRH